LIILIFLCYILCFTFISTIKANSCEGTIGSYSYDLSHLVIATGNAVASAKDQNDNTYYYHPCNILNLQECLAEDPGSVLCQKDVRVNPQYHDIGSITTVTWRSRSNGPQTGFILSFSGGEEDRKGDIEFICDESGGIGSFQTKSPTESPTHVYHFVWSTMYACPTNSTPYDEALCCYYSAINGPNKALCTELNATCPEHVGPYYNTGNETVESCSECHPDNSITCCVYEDRNDIYNMTTKCASGSGGCPPAGYGEDLISRFPVNSCSDCFFSLDVDNNGKNRK